MDSAGDLGADGPAVEGVPPAVGDGAQGGGQQRLAEGVALGTAGASEHGTRGVVEGRQRGGD